MGEPELTWPKVHPDVQPPLRWVRWLVAVLILMTLALAGHTSGRVAREIMGQTKHWLHTTVSLPKGLKWGSLSWPHTSSGTSTAAQTPHWISPVSRATLVERFGWKGTGAHAVFHSAVVLQVRGQTPVLAGASALIQKVGTDTIVFRSGSYQVTFRGVKPSDLKRGERVHATTRLGTAASHTLKVAVTRDGYPVNPLGSALYGSRFLRR